MDETRGTLFWNILKIIDAHHPPVVVLENVRNLAGPRHRHELQVIIEQLRAAGYHVSEEPSVFSPHLLPLELGGRPHVRERVFITASYDPDGMGDLDPPPAVTNRSLRQTEEWSLEADLPLDPDHHAAGCDLSADEVRWINAWDDWVTMMWCLRRAEAARTGDPLRKLPGFPIWSDAWVLLDDLVIPAETPAWKANFLRKNAALYTDHRAEFDAWSQRHGVAEFPVSRRKFEWQAQSAERLWDCVMQLRPSGIRAKRPTHLPALVAITQTPVIGPRKRRLSPREAARLQGLPDGFTFGEQTAAATYKQLGNGVNVGAVWHVLREHVRRDEAILKRTPTGRRILQTILEAPTSPDEVLDDVVRASQAGQ